MRGGSLVNGSWVVRVSARNWNIGGIYDRHIIGFRLVQDIEP